MLLPSTGPFLQKQGEKERKPAKLKDRKRRNLLKRNLPREKYYQERKREIE